MKVVHHVFEDSDAVEDLERSEVDSREVSEFITAAEVGFPPLFETVQCFTITTIW